jgi:hypothetical protein
MQRIFFLIFILVLTLHASFSEDKLKVIIMGKVAKYVVWQKKEKNFYITIIDNPFGTLPKEIYKDKKINNKPIILNFIKNIQELKHTDMLFIPKSQASQLQNIIHTIKGQGIFTVSDIKGFAQKKGMLQLYFVSRKIKLKINLDAVKKEHLNIRSTLLRIAKVIKEKDEI